MGRWFVLVIIGVLLSACDGSGGNTTAPPVRETMPDVSTAISPETTSTIAPTLTPTFPPSPTPVPTSLILADFPLSVGATWKYAAEITYQPDPQDYTRPVVWSGFITDKIIDRMDWSERGIAFTFEEDFKPTPPDGSSQPTDFEYRVSGDGIFLDDMKIYQWPLSSKLSWMTSSIFGNIVNVKYVGAVNTPYGELKGCYTFLLQTSPYTTIDTFCPGTGFVERYYVYHGTFDEAHLVLVSYKPGQ